MTAKLTPKQNEVLKHMWDMWFARSMTMGDYSRNTVASLEAKGLVAFDWDAKSDAPMYGLTAYGFSHCEAAFGPRKNANTSADEAPQ